MLLRVTFVAMLVALVGCAETAPPSPPPASSKAKSALPPEVEFDPVTATAKHQAARKTRRQAQQ